MTFALSASLLVAVLLSLSAGGGLTFWHMCDGTSRPGRVDAPVQAVQPFDEPAAHTPGIETPPAPRRPVTTIASIASGLLLLALVCSVWLARQWIRPLRALQRAAQRIARGDLAARVVTNRSDEIGELARDVNRMAERLERMEGTRRRWMADLAHELRTPLAALSHEMDALIDGARPLNRAAMALMKEQTLRLQAVVEDMQLLATTPPQAPTCHLAELDATGMVEHILKRHQHAADEAGLTLGWASTRPPPLQVWWDAPRIERVLNNLVQNSLQFTDAPGRIEVGLQNTAHCVQLTIDDSAPCVEPCEAGFIFEPLYRVDPTMVRHTRRRGLGLAVSAAVVHAHGGLISAHPSPLGGLRIEIDLPIQPEETP